MLTIAVLGYGRVGHSVVQAVFGTSTGRQGLRDTIARLHKRHEADCALQFVVWDQRHLEPLEHAAIIRAGGVVADQSVSSLIEQADYCIVSPGVDAIALGVPTEKHICELDLFATLWRQPVIAVTGSLGKTSVVSMLADVLDQISDKKVLCGGNIGKSMLSLLSEQKKTAVALLELSSFQLEHAKLFNPVGALLTNIYPNHLDRHRTLEAYVAAKQQLWRKKQPSWSVLPVQALDMLQENECWQDMLTGSIHWVAANDAQIAQWHLFELPSHHHLLYQSDRMVYVCQADKQPIVLGEVPEHMRVEHALIVYAAVYAFCGAPACQLVADIDVTQHAHYRAHRLEQCLEVNGVTFYNDSKATIYQATIAAVQQLAQSKRFIHLILGGQNKGVDRTPLVAALEEIKSRVRVVAYGVTDRAFEKYEQYTSLCQAVYATMRHVRPGDLVLFSPSGTSFDSFRNYQERGQAFVRLVQYWAAAMPTAQSLPTSAAPHEYASRSSCS